MAQLKLGTTIGGNEALHKGNSATVATSGSYTDLSNKPTIHTINDSSTTSTTNTWSAKKLNDTFATKASTAVATTSANGLMSSADKTKLDGVAANANNYTHPTADGSKHVPANGTTNGGKYLRATATAGTYEWASLPTASTSVTGLVQLNDSVTSTSVTQAATANAVKKAYDLASSKASTSVATTSANGLMSSADKTKLDGVAANANNYTHPSTHPHTMITGLGTAATVNTGTTSGTIPVLGSDGKLNTSVLPAIAITDTFVVASQTAMLALDAQVGDVAVRTDIQNTFILKGSDATVLANWIEIMTPADGVQSVNGKTGASITLDASEVGARPSTWVPTWGDVTNKVSATTSVAGIVQLNDGVASTSTTQAATANAVKKAYDLANGKASTAVATTTANGLMSSADKTKLDGVAANANNYTHPTADGSKHVPANGTTNGGKVLRATATAGSYEWYTIPTSSVTASGLVQLNDTVASTSTSLAATANSVKTAYDKAVDALNAANHSHPYDNYQKWVLSVNTEATPLNMTTGTKLDLKAGSNVSISRSGSTVTINSSYSNTASAVSNILSGSNSGTAVTYAPYTAQQAKLSFDTSTTAPTRTDRLNLNGNLHATNLHVGSESTDARYFRRGTSNASDLRLASSDGRGLRFADSDNNKIYMSTSANTTWGGRIGEETSVNNMYFQMKNDTDGFVFKSINGAVAGVDASGNITAKGAISGAEGAFKLEFNAVDDCIEFVFAD